jgi:hypothetical protein
MNIFKWMVGRSSARGAAMSHYKRGLARVRKRDPQGAMDAFTLAIELADAPEDVKAMALYNRALLFAGLGDTAQALADLNAVITMPAPLRSIKLATRRRLERIQHQQDVSAAGHWNARPAQ